MKDFIQPKLFEIISAEILKYQDFHRKDFAWTEGLTISIISKIVEGQNILGMVPEDECVRLPKPEEWPEWATGVRMVFEEGLAWVTPAKDGINAVSVANQKIRVAGLNSYIKRPIRAWTPKVGDAVFWRTSAQILKFMGPSMREGYYVLSNGVGATLDELKPAKSIDQIDKPWEEIPNGLS